MGSQKTRNGLVTFFANKFFLSPFKNVSVFIFLSAIIPDNIDKKKYIVFYYLIPMII